MLFDPELLQQVAQDDWVQRVVQAYDGDGDRLQELLTAVRQTFEVISPETLEDGVTVFVDAACSDQFATAGTKLESLDTLVDFIGSHISICFTDGEFTFWQERVEPNQLSQSAPAYYYNGADQIVTQAASLEILSPTGFYSLFAVPTFSDLEDALTHYDSAHARHSRCKILESCWHSDHRVLLANKPEESMRDSLEQFLVSTLRNHKLVEVRPEQNVDASHPADLKVAWTLTNRIAFIEIKWLGDSVTQSGTSLTTYRDARAREGEQQIAEYLDFNRKYTPNHDVRGYLVVFDARRSGARFAEADLTAAEAHHYALSSIDYGQNPLHESRRDLAEPVRFFMNPRVAAA